MKNKIFKRALSMLLAVLIGFPTGVGASAISDGEIVANQLTDKAKAEFPVTLAATLAEQALELSTGWVQSGGVWKYYDEEHRQVTGWMELDGKKYYLSPSDGTLIIGWIEVGGNWYYANANGEVQNGWVEIEAKWYYMNAAGIMQIGWIQDGDNWHYMAFDGVMHMGWLQDGKAWYFFDKTYGIMQTGWVQNENNWYYMNAAGIMQTGWLQDGANWHYLNSSGAMYTGLFQDGKAWYFFDKAYGVMRTGWVPIENNWYFMDAEGVMQTGWIQDGNNWHRLNLSGTMYTGWFQDGKDWFFFDRTYGIMQIGWAYDSNWFYFSKNGIMQTGWRDIDKKWYYLDSGTGIMVTGWNEINKKWYFMDASGAMMTGWLTQGGKWYYLDSDGAMATASKVIDGKTYYFDKDGEWIENNWPDFIYVTDPDGKSRKVEPEILTDPQIGVDISEEEFFAAVIYTEANDQGYEGALMSALSIINRVYTRSDYPNSLKFVVYADSQFAVVRRNADGSDGPLTTQLKYIRDNGFAAWKKRHSSYAMSAQVAVDAKAQLKEHVGKGKPRTIPGITLPNGKTDFDYVMFMTPAAFDRNNLDREACDSFVYKGHIYFKNWIKY